MKQLSTQISELFKEYFDDYRNCPIYYSKDLGFRVKFIVKYRKEKPRDILLGKRRYSCALGLPDVRIFLFTWQGVIYLHSAFSQAWLPCLMVDLCAAVKYILCWYHRLHIGVFMISLPTWIILWSCDCIRTLVVIKQKLPVVRWTSDATWGIYRGQVTREVQPSVCVNTPI